MRIQQLAGYISVILTGILISTTPATRLACPAARAADEAPKVETLNNASIIELQGLNLGDSVIIDKIKASKCDFDVTVAGLKQLKAAKVSDDVIKAMINAKVPPTEPAAAPASPNEVKPLPTGDQNNPTVQHDSGIWLYEETGGVKTMTQLNAESYRIWSGMNGPWGTAERAVLAGIAAKTQVSSRRPVFYIYFGEGSQMNFGTLGTTTPDQIPLAKLDLKPKTQERLLVIGSGAAYAGYNSGIRTKSLREFNSEKIAAGVFKVTPTKDLEDGEYAFCYYPSQVQMGTAGRMFSFGVHMK
jgi:hypothetical protein